MPSQDHVQPVLIDPVCGMPSSATSLHHYAHGGAMFYFCSEACCVRFISDPLSCVNVHKTEHDDHSPVSVPEAKTIREELDHPVVGVQIISKTDRIMGRQFLQGGWRGLITS